jgi:hypothetical protein
MFLFWNSDGQQFHQYQQNKQSSITSNYDVRNPSTSIGQAHTCSGVKPLNVFPKLPLLILGSTTAMQIHAPWSK